MQKRKTNIRLLIFVVILAILISSDVLALETQNIDIQEQAVSVDELKSTILFEINKSTGLENIKEYTNIDTFVSTVKNIYPTMTDVELAQEIMRATGDDEETISKTPEEKKMKS